MRCKQLISTLLACMLFFGCSFIPVKAADIDTPASNSVISRVSGRLNYSLPADGITLITQPFSAAKGDTIKYDCTYTPKSASIDFGYIDSDSVFHYLNYTNGSINQSFEIARAGQYTLAIRNNESYAVTVTGTVRY